MADESCPPVPRLYSRITGALRQIFIYRFSSADRISQDILKNYIWTSDPETSRILIESVTRWNVRAMQQRPAIVIKRNSVSTVQLGIDDGIRVGAPSSIEDVGEIKQIGMTGSHTIFAIAGTGAETEALAQECFHELVEYGSVLRKDLGLHKFRAVEVGPVAKLEEDRERWVSPIVCGWAYVYAWRLRPYGPTLKTFDVDIILEV